MHPQHDYPTGKGAGHALLEFSSDVGKAIAAVTGAGAAGGHLIGGNKAEPAKAAVAAVSKDIAAVAVVSIAGIYVLGSLRAAAEDASDEAAKKTWGREKPVEHGGTGQGGDDPKKHREGDSYPDPDGAGGGPVDPKWIPADDGPGSGGGNPLWIPAGDDDQPPKPTMIWDENGGGGTPNTIGQLVEFEAITGPGLLANVAQVGWRTYQFP
jgi:hypothetical protein